MTAYPCSYHTQFIWNTGRQLSPVFAGSQESNEKLPGFERARPEGKQNTKAEF